MNEEDQLERLIDAVLGISSDLSDIAQVLDHWLPKLIEAAGGAQDD